MNKQEVFLRKQEARIQKGVLAIFRKQEDELIEILERERKSYSTKSIQDDIEWYIETIKSQIPDYLFESLQYVMNRAYKQALKPFRSYMKDYKAGLVFDIDSEPAVKFLRNMQTLHLSERDGSIFKTTKKEILTILSEGVRLGKSYTEIAKEIRGSQKFVFSKSRAELIAIQETGKAYGWANYDPAREMMSRGYKMEKIWVTSHDDRVRHTHTDNARQGWIDIKKVWGATGDMYAPSSNDFRCRCASNYRVIG